MKKTTLAGAAMIGLLALSLLLLPQRPAEAKKNLLRQLQLIKIALLLEPANRPFKARELATLRKALPSVKEENPKLYKDPRRTEKILLLYMILEQIERAAKGAGGINSMVGKTRGQVAREFVARVYPAK